MSVEGVVTALVKDVDDPLEEGRVQIWFPWLSDEVSGWAPIAAPMGGKERGYFYMPEVDDEALVAFDHGDIDHPFVIGFLHNGQHVPPDDDIDKHVRRIQSVSGHVVDLDDREGQERVLVKTQGGNSVELRDADATIEIATDGGQKITMQDTPAQIKLKTSTGTSVTISDAPSQVEVKTITGVTVTVADTGVTVTAASAPVTVTGATATVNATGSATVNGSAITLNGAAVSVNSALTTFSGVVVCSSLITQAVVSPIYTPGVGNLI
jgi:uncharacterized protein involved in type VI secretion and phage assembly